MYHIEWNALMNNTYMYYIYIHVYSVLLYIYMYYTYTYMYTVYYYTYTCTIHIHTCIQCTIIHILHVLYMYTVYYYTYTCTLQQTYHYCYENIFTSELFPDTNHLTKAILTKALNHMQSKYMYKRAHWLHICRHKSLGSQSTQIT